MEHALACEARTQFLPFHRPLVLSPALLPRSTRTIRAADLTTFGVGHGQTHDLAAITDCSRIGLHRLPLRVVGCHPTFHHLAVAYGPCPECLNYISHNRVRVGNPGVR